MATLATDTDVLIVGAGPVGLFLANECARRSVRWKLIEERSSQSVHSKALAIFPRTLEIFDMAGLVAPFLQEANRVTAVAVITHGHRLAQMRFAPHESAYSFIAMVPQNVTEDLLLKALQNRAGNVEYETKFLSSSQEADHVNVTVERKGERMNFTARFVVGCDGAHSTVRHGLGLTLEGGEYHDSFMLADIETNDALPGNELQLCPSELGPVAIFPMSAERRRIVATIKEPQGEAPSLELVRKILRDRAPAGIEARGLHWSSYFRIHHRNVSHLRVGRVFLAGDAAHIHSPVAAAICPERLRLQDGFLSATVEFTRSLNDQMLAAIASDSSRFAELDSRIMDAANRRHEAKQSLLKHIQEHGCAPTLSVILSSMKSTEECQRCADLQNKHSEATNQLLKWEAKRQLAAVVPSPETEETINRRLREVSAACVSLRKELLAHMKSSP